jgi:CheY-like chemotaxis protein
MSLSKGTILVVDDEKAVLDMAANFLRSAEFEVVVSDSGYGAFTLLEQQVRSLGELKVDLVIVDWRMSGWDGIKLLTEIRTRPYGNIPVILMSGAVTREELVSAARNRADSVLVKPIEKDGLINKVLEVLARTRKPNLK